MSTKKDFVILISGVVRIKLRVSDTYTFTNLKFIRLKYVNTFYLKIKNIRSCK